MPSTVSPFPWSAIARVTRGEVVAARRILHAPLRLEAVAARLGELAKGQVSLRLVRATRAEPHAADDFVGAVLAPAGERSPSRRVLVELEGALAASLTARALGHSAPVLPDASRPAVPAVAGATAALVHAALRRATDVPLRVVSAGPGPALARDLLASGGGATAWIAVTVDGATFSARVTATDGLLDTSAGATAFDVGALGPLPLALAIVAGQVTLARREVWALAPGDVLLPAGRLSGGEALTGAVALAAPRAERGLACDLADGDRLVLRGDLAELPWTARGKPLSARGEDEMAESTSTTQTSMALEDAPVVVRVEIGAVEMTARAWGELGPGDVIPLGTRVGDPVVLRAAGIEIARGELVVVDGEVGVRVLARSGGGS